MQPIIKITNVRASAALACALVLALAAAASAQPKRIYIANDDHTDYFWTGDDVQYRKAFLAMLDYYMTRAEQTATLPSDQRSRFNTDGTLWIWEYEHNKTAAQLARLVGHIKKGNISVPLNSLVLLFGAMPTEAVLRDMYYAGRLERRHSLNLDLVVPMENQTLPGGVASLWAGAGARYAWKGICNCATKTKAADRPREIYHMAGPDGRSVVMKWSSQLWGGSTSLGGYAEARYPQAVVKLMATDSTFHKRWPWSVAGAFGYGWDDLQSTTDAFVKASQALGTPSRRVIVSNEVDFFTDFVAAHGKQIPTFSAAHGNEWDLLTASLGEVSAGMRRQLERLRAAEAMAALVALVDPGAVAAKTAARDEAFMRMGLYYEHDWTADGNVGSAKRQQFQRASLAKVKAYVDGLHKDAMVALCDRVRLPSGSGIRYMVFNPLAWTRTDAAVLPLTPTGPVKVIDVSTGVEVPGQVVTQPGGAKRLVILASGVPPLGYRVYQIKPGTPKIFTPSASISGSTMDNGKYRVSVSGDGSITSWVDKTAGNRQLVASGGALNRLAGVKAKAVVLEASGPVLTTMRATASGSPALVTRVTLYRGLARVDVDNRLSGGFGATLGYQYPFKLGSFVARHEEVGMIARAARKAAGGDYADKNTRTDYLTLNHFVDLSESSYGVTLSSWDSAFMRLGNSTASKLDTATPSVLAVVGMQVDGSSLGFTNQGGDTSFLNRYALRSHGAYDQAGAMRFSLEHQNPFETAKVGGVPGGPLPAGKLGLLSISSPNVLGWAVKPAEEGIAKGLIVRLWNLSDNPQKFTLGFDDAAITKASRASHVETDTGAATVSGGKLSDTLARQQMQTYRLFRPAMIKLAPPDGGVPVNDSGGPLDPPDAGPQKQLDGGSGADARTADARTADTSKTPDASQTPDARGPDAPSESSSCAVGGGGGVGLAWGLLLLALALARWRQRSM